VIVCPNVFVLCIALWLLIGRPFFSLSFWHPLLYFSLTRYTLLRARKREKPSTEHRNHYVWSKKKEATTLE
jgi:hypothetical protein